MEGLLTQTVPFNTMDVPYIKVPKQSGVKSRLDRKQALRDTSAHSEKSKIKVLKNSSKPCRQKLRHHVYV
jgi:hypothetical protein